MAVWRMAKQGAIIKQPCKKLIWCTPSVNTDMKRFTESARPDTSKFGVYDCADVVPAIALQQMPNECEENTH